MAPFQLFEAALVVFPDLLTIVIRDTHLGNWHPARAEATGATGAIGVLGVVGARN